MKKKWYALNSHQIDEIKEQKARESLRIISKELLDLVNKKKQ